MLFELVDKRIEVHRLGKIGHRTAATEQLPLQCQVFKPVHFLTRDHDDRNVFRVLDTLKGPSKNTFFFL